MTSGGSSDSDVSEFTVNPNGDLVSIRVEITHTPVGYSDIVARNSFSDIDIAVATSGAIRTSGYW